MMNQPCHLNSRAHQPLILAILSLLLIPSCSPPIERPTGPARDYEDAKDMFKRGRFDRTLEFTDGLATASPPTKFTDRARVLRVVVFSGYVKAYKELADAYAKGVENTKNPHFQAAFGQQRHDNLQYASKSALGLGEVAHQITQAGTFPKEWTLEAPYPPTEGPIEVKDLIRVSQGGWIEAEQQESVSLDAVRKGVDDALAEVVGGDRAKARATLSAGSVKLDGVDFALYLGKALIDAASIFDRKHMHDPQKFRTLSNEADEVAKAALALLKENPNKDKEKAVKKFQDQIKAGLKAL